MLNTIIKRFNQFWRSNDGTAIIEFGLLAPAFLFMLLGAMQVGILLIIQNALDMAAYQGAQFGMTGYTNAGRNSTINQIITTAAQTYSMNLINTTNLVIKSSVYPTLSTVGLIATGSNNYGTAGQIVQYQVSYTWPTLFASFSHSGNVKLVGNAITINEIF